MDSYGQELVKAIAWKNVVDIKFKENLPIIVITILSSTFNILANAFIRNYKSLNEQIC